MTEKRHGSDPPEKLHLPTNTHCKTVGHELIDKNGDPTTNLDWMHSNGLPFCAACHDDHKKIMDHVSRPKDKHGKAFTHCENGHEIDYSNIIHISAGAAGVISFCADCHGPKEKVKKAISDEEEKKQYSANIPGVSNRANLVGAWNGPVRLDTIKRGTHLFSVRSGDEVKPGDRMTIEHPIPLSRGGSNVESALLWSKHHENVGAGDKPITEDQFKTWHTNTYGQPPSPATMGLMRGVISHANRTQVGTATTGPTPFQHSSRWQFFHNMRTYHPDLSDKLFEDLSPEGKEAYKHWDQTQNPKNVPVNQRWRNFRRFTMGHWIPEFNDENQLTNRMTKEGTDRAEVSGWFGGLKQAIAHTGMKASDGKPVVSKTGAIHKEWKKTWAEFEKEPLKLDKNGGIVPHAGLARLLSAAHRHQLKNGWESLGNEKQTLPAVSKELKDELQRRADALKQERTGNPKAKAIVPIGVRKSWYEHSGYPTKMLTLDSMPPESLHPPTRKPLLVLR